MEVLTWRSSLLPEAVGAGNAQTQKQELRVPPRAEVGPRSPQARQVRPGPFSSGHKCLRHAGRGPAPGVLAQRPGRADGEHQAALSSALTQQNLHSRRWDRAQEWVLGAQSQLLAPLTRAQDPHACSWLHQAGALSHASPLGTTARERLDRGHPASPTAPDLIRPGRAASCRGSRCPWGPAGP